MYSILKKAIPLVLWELRSFRYLSKHISNRFISFNSFYWFVPKYRDFIMLTLEEAS